MIINNLRVLRLAYNLYFKMAPWPVRVSCSIRLLKNRLLKARAPISIMIGVTYRCQCRCAHCGMELSRVDPRDELRLDEVRSVIRQARELGAVEITLFGGEPLLREDIEEIIGYARMVGMLPSLDTNGLLLAREKVAALKLAGISAVKVSLDSPFAGEHDHLRGLTGCFERAVRGIRECVEQGLPCVISTYATRENIHSGNLEKIIELGRGLDVDAVRIIDTTLSGCFITATAKKLSPPERQQLAKLLEPGFVFLENLASSRALTHPVCSAVAKRYIYVSPGGDVQPCCFVPLSFGNVRKESLKWILESIWSSSLMKHDIGQCMMNNPEFRKKYLHEIENARILPIKFKE